MLITGWTKAHAFFIIMGGYHAYDQNGALFPLEPDAVVQLVRKGKLLPLMTDELSDKSKGDDLSKGLAILQTIWFVVQCIARFIEGLPLTHLEVMTLAYTVMTVAMYITWWDKPLNVNCAIRVPGVPFKGEPKRIHILIEIFGYLAGDRDSYVDIRKLPRVPTFWAGTPRKETVGYADAVGLLVAIAFGAVHCIAWSYALPSPVKVLLWRVSAIAIIAIPVGGFLASPFIWRGDGQGESELSRTLLYLLFSSFWLSCTYVFVGFFIYIGARMILLLLSFTALKGLHYTVFQATQWVDFIPHL